MVYTLTQLTKFDAVQRWLAAFVSDKVEQGLDIPLCIRQLRVESINEVTLTDVLVLDERHDTLIYANEAAASIDINSLLDGKVHINTLALAAPDIRLNRATPDSPINAQFIIDNLSKENRQKKETDLRINQLIIYDGKFRYDVFSEKHDTDRLDPNHIEINDFASNISLKHFNKKSLNLYIRSINGREKSGLALQKLRARVSKQENDMILSNFKLELPGCDITSDTIVLTQESEGKPVAFKGGLRCSRLTLNDIAPLFPELPEGLPELSFDIQGRADSATLRSDITIAATDGSLSIEGKATVTDPLGRRRRIDITLDRLRADESTIEKAASMFGNVPQDISSKLGDTDIDGKITLSRDTLNGYANINSKNGSFTATIASDSTGRYTLSARGTALHLGNITGQKGLETCDIKGTSRGNLQGKGTLADFDIEISDLRFREYTYAPIRVKGKAYKENVQATIATADANIDATLDLSYSRNRHGNRINIRLGVDSIKPYNLHLYKKEEHSFAFSLNSEIELRNNGKSLSNIRLQNFTFNDGEETAVVGNIHLYDNNTEEERSISINSDILNADIIGKFDAKRLAESYKHMLNSHIPSLALKEHRKRLKDEYIYKLEITDSKLLSKLFDLPFTINEKSHVKGSCLGKKNEASIEAELNNITLGRTVFRAINLKGKSDNEELVIDANVIKPHVDKKRILHYDNYEKDLIVDLNSTIKNDTIRSIINWSKFMDKEKDRGTLRTDAMLNRDDRGRLGVEAYVSPGSFTLDGAQWHITPGEIRGNSEKIAIRDLGLYNNDQSLRIEGYAGIFIDDSLNVHLNRMDVGTILGLTNFQIFKFNGNASGSAHLTSLLHKPDANGHFHIDSLQLDGEHMGDCELDISWMSYNKTISLDCDIIGKETTSKVEGILSQARDTIMLKIDADKLNIGFLNKKLNAFLYDTRGTASGAAYIHGRWRKVDLEGSLLLDNGCSTRVRANNTTYLFDEDSLYLRPGVIEFKNLGIRDIHGNGGTLNGKLLHNNLSKWTCDIDVIARKMLVYDTHDFSSMPFYGSVYASGEASIKSEGIGVSLSATMNSEPNSSFVYNSTTASGAKDNSFVTFVDSSKKSSIYTSAADTGNKNTYDLVTSKINLEFMLDVTDDFHIKVFTDMRTGDYIDFYGNGPITALYDEKSGFSMNGTLNLERGTYKFTIQDIFPKEFNIQRGSTLSFNGDPFKAALNLKTKYLVPSASLSDLTTETAKNKTVKVNCIMDIGGTLASPALTFDLELPEGSGEEKELLASVASTTEQKNMQFIYLLGVGKFYTYDYNNTNNESQSSTAMESLISNTLSGQLNNMLGQIINNDNWDISGNFSSSEKGWSRMEVEGMLRGRLLNNRLLINGNFGYRENPIANSNFIGDFELQWLLTPKGNINLKAYSKTNDRYFSKTNLTTQGAGILFKHDFDSWRWWKKKEKEDEAEEDKEKTETGKEQESEKEQ